MSVRSTYSPAARPAIVQEASTVPGRPLDVQTRRAMETQFSRYKPNQSPERGISQSDDSAEQEATGMVEKISESSQEKTDIKADFDFSKIRIHTDPVASKSAHALNARAYATGSEIYFRQGHFNPATQDGRRLLAHELVHAVQWGGRDAHTAPISRQVESESEEEERRKAGSQFDSLAGIVPPVVGDDAPSLIAWAQKTAAEFENPATSETRRFYLAEGLLRAHRQLQEFATRAPRDPTGALLYIDAYQKVTPWVPDGATSLEMIPPFAPEAIAVWQNTALLQQKGSPTKLRQPDPQSSKRKRAAASSRSSGLAKNITFHKGSGMTLKTEEGQRNIIRFVLSSTRTGKTADELEWVAARLPLLWAPKPGTDASTSMEEFENIPFGGEVTLTLTESFELDADNLFSEAPMWRDFQLEGFRQGVLDSRSGLYLGIGTLAVGTLALGGGAIIGSALGAAGGTGIAAGGILGGEGSSLAGGALGHAARTAGTYAYLNAPALAGDAMLYGGATASGISLGQHLQDVRANGLSGDDPIRFLEDIAPLASGYVESLALRSSGGGGGKEPPDEESGGKGGTGGRQTIRSSPPPMPKAVTAPKVDAQPSSPGPSNTTVGDDVVVEAFNTNPASVRQNASTRWHQSRWEQPGASLSDGGGRSGVAPTAFRNPDGDIEVDIEAWLSKPRPSIGVNLRPGAQPPPWEYPTTVPKKVMNAAAGDIGLEQTGQPAPAAVPASPAKPAVNVYEKTGARPDSSAASGPRTAASAPRTAEPLLPVEVSPERVLAIAEKTPGMVRVSASSDAHRQGWEFNGGAKMENGAPIAFIAGKTIYVDPTSWPKDKPLK